MADGDSKKRLGRGLAALIGDLDPEPSPAAATGEAAAAAAVQDVPRADRDLAIERIRANPHNPRRQFTEEHLADLARSIGEHGIVQPILVRPIPGRGDYEIIAGERRWRAAQKAGLHEIPVIIREVEDREALELAIIENVQRADLNPLEEAQGYQQLIDDHRYTQADLGDVIGKSRSHVANTMRLLKLPDAVQQMVASGDLSAGHARALITSDAPIRLAERVIRDGLSVRQTEELAQQKSPANQSSVSGRDAERKSADTKALEARIEAALGLKADIRERGEGKGEIRLRYRELDQLEEICRRLGVG